MDSLENLSQFDLHKKLEEAEIEIANGEPGEDFFAFAGELRLKLQSKDIMRYKQPDMK